MRNITRIRNLQRISAGLKRQGRKIALVPTMGALHRGHLSLVTKAQKLADTTIVSIYVNPKQFGEGEDHERYPRQLSADRAKLKKLGVNILFAPDDAEMYPGGYSTFVEVEGVTSKLEGVHRPGHFRGVTTIVMKLLQAASPDLAVFGQKDAQQALVIKKMVSELNVPVKIVVAPTVREDSGLAMSSRNQYLNEEQKERATCIYRGLRLGGQMVIEGETDPARVVESITDIIENTPGTRIDYVSVNDANSLDDLDNIGGRALISAAVWLDGVRLIDNIVCAPGRRRKKHRHD
jgi:pantoate--beta-alanine ligase